MKLVELILSVFIALSPLLGMSNASEIIGKETSGARIVLYTCYRQEGWGDGIRLGYVDEDGCLWSLTLESNTIDFHYKVEKQLDYLLESGIADRVGQLDMETFALVKEQLASVTDDCETLPFAACDAGLQFSYAVRYSQDGAREIITLGASGDVVIRNNDESAKPLYLLLRKSFPYVTSYRNDRHLAPFVGE